MNVLASYMGRLIGCVTTYFGSIVESSMEKALQTGAAGYTVADEFIAESRGVSGPTSFTGST